MILDSASHNWNSMLRSWQSVEPNLFKLSGKTLIPKTANKSSEARLDISAREVLATGQRAFFDVRVFNPFARLHSLNLIKPMKVKRSDATMTA